MITEPSLDDVRLSGKIFSPGMPIVSGGAAAAAGKATSAIVRAPREANSK
jgi:hypothetical protein